MQDTEFESQYAFTLVLAGLMSKELGDFISGYPDNKTVKDLCDSYYYHPIIPDRKDAYDCAYWIISHIGDGRIKEIKKIINL